MWSVLILYENSLFAHGLERLLRQKGVKVVGVILKDNKALDRVRTLKPDVIIAEVERKQSGPEALLTKLLHKQPQAKVVRVSLEDNTATLYSGRHWTANTVEELVDGMLNSVAPGRGARKQASV